MNTNDKIPCKPPLLVFGEILWDMLPAGARPGGAPANVAVLAHAIGAHCLLASAVGDDEPGHDMLELLCERDFPTTHVQVIAGAPTGAVDVTITGTGIPAYRIRENTAWDHIALTSELAKTASCAAAFYFGSLAQRSGESRATLKKLLQTIPANCMRFFDANLREPWPSADVLRDSLAHADILKLNHEELPLLASWLGLPTEERAFADAVFARHPVRTLLLTKGPAGADVFDKGVEPVRVPASPAERIIDTVGAGDAFSAGFIDGCLRGLSSREAAQCGSDFAARVCENAGAWLPPRALRKDG
ncbi:carbohydrate kinase family protein [Ereboglobus luteus]|uniref:Carbohydrate kinase n=1 Tax=Ereboglobus luteus TaxID=1796921 RepID=A0A2U8E4Y7_9BACT|nr:carbohydrate kinase [Ereboglobus luteus]AWI10008.1 carbohydrate kinase [Ereboglobus luteus]